jgi:acetoin utilization deacetylase AcuC-like enzyme
MKVVFTDDHRLHFAQGEISGGEFVTPFERPSRMEYILRELKKRKMDTIIPPKALDMKAVARVHDKGFLKFLESAWREWTKAGYRGEIVPTGFPARSMQQRCPKHIDGKVGYYIHSVETCITAGTWDAARASASVALTAQKLIADGERAAFALCRPPGHQAHDDLYGGYCFLNNAAIATQAFRDSGAARVAILDVDFHHGNGTQDIFYDRNDVLFCSLHGEPETATPISSATRTDGAGKGEVQLQLSLAGGKHLRSWSKALGQACGKIKFCAGCPGGLLASIPTKRPISYFKLKSGGFH